MNNEVVSVIIPVFKVENYINKCIDSVISQSYQYLEIILVDDGSPDECGLICDEYAKRDSRIIVIHKQNGGLSDARNQGMSLATGRYLTFLDSDDWWGIDYVMNSVSLLESHDADIVVFPLCRVDENGAILKTIGTRSIKILDPSQAMESMFSPNGVPWCAQGKMYKRELFNGIQYPVGLLMEDKATTYKVFHKSRKIVFADFPDYLYLIRRGSIMHSSFSEKKARTFDIQLQLNDFISENYPHLINVSKAFTARVALSMLCKMIASNYSDKEAMRSMINHWQSNKKEMYQSSITDNRFKIFSRLSSVYYLFYSNRMNLSPTYKVLCRIVSSKLNSR